MSSLNVFVIGGWEALIGDSVSTWLTTTGLEEGTYLTLDTCGA
tara:strand:+ start:1406 stop:1534 length:129 start_codon:yes stop_codon:yes gene_type:complete